VKTQKSFIWSSKGASDVADIDVLPARGVAKSRSGGGESAQKQVPLETAMKKTRTAR